jgi:hypothetical protein
MMWRWWLVGEDEAMERERKRAGGRREGRVS